MSLGADTEGRLLVQVRNTQGDLIVEDQSAIIRMEERIPIKLCIGSDKHALKIAVNGKFILYRNGAEEIPAVVVIERPPPMALKDFSLDNATQIKARRERVLSWGAYPGKKRGNTDFVLKGVETALKQLRDFLAAIQGGSYHHVESLIGLLRMLIAQGQPLPLLQLAAGLVDLPLIVYGEASPPTKGPDGSIYCCGGSCFPIADEIHPNPVDLDVWLNQFWGHLDGQSRTHKEVLNDLGNTRGAHFSWDIHKAETVLRAIQTGFGGKREELIAGYLLPIGRSVLGLCEFVLVNAGKVVPD